MLLDWELAQIGDPREDLGYFKAVAQAAPPDLTAADELYSRYRQLTGLDETQVNPAVVSYFLILGVIGTVRRLLEGGAAFARGDNHLSGARCSTSTRCSSATRMWLQASIQLEAVLTPAGTS